MALDTYDYTVQFLTAGGETVANGDYVNLTGNRLTQTLTVGGTADFGQVVYYGANGQRYAVPHGGGWELNGWAPEAARWSPSAPPSLAPLPPFAPREERIALPPAPVAEPQGRPRRAIDFGMR